MANLMPAVVEAHEGRVAMLLLTADRPAILRGSRSNQTTRQAGLFGAFARLSLDIDVAALGQQAAGSGTSDRTLGADIDGLSRQAVSAAVGQFGGDPAGPVQLNLQFSEPLSGWPAGATADFGGGQMTAAEFFALAAAARDESLPVAAPHREQVGAYGWQRGGDPAATAHGPANVADKPATTAHAQPAAGQGPIVISGDRAYYTYLPGEEDIYLHGDDRLTVVIAGEGAGVAAEQFAREAGLPLLAEVVSGSRYGREAIATYATLIDDPTIGGLIERAVVFGHPTLTRQVPALLTRDDVEVVVVDPHTGAGVDHYAPHRDGRVVRAAAVNDQYDPKGMRRWLGAWVIADRALRESRSTVHAPDLAAARETGYKERNAYARAEVAVKRERISRELLVESVWRATWPHDRLVLGASRLVRVLDAIAAPRAVEVRSNRGLAGIDGTVATAFGVAVASQSDDRPAVSAGTTRVILGDLALLHDAGSLLLPPGEPHPRLQLFVGNDGGGTIFDLLEVAQAASQTTFDRVMYTPQRVDLESLARAYGWQYRRVNTRGELENLLTEPVTGPQLVEAPLDR